MSEEEKKDDIIIEEEKKDDIIDSFKKNPLKINKIYKEHFEGKGVNCIYCNICKSCCCCMCEAEKMGMEYCSRFGGAGSGIHKNYGYISAKIVSTFKKMATDKIYICEQCTHHIDEHEYVEHPEGAEYINL